MAAMRTKVTKFSVLGYPTNDIASLYIPDKTRFIDCRVIGISVN